MTTQSFKWGTRAQVIFSEDRGVKYTKNTTNGQKQSGKGDIFSTNSRGYKLCEGQKKQELSSLAYPFIPKPLVSFLRSLILHPSTKPIKPLTDWQPPLWGFVSVGKNTHTHTDTHRRTHTPVQHLIRCHDSPVSGAAPLFCCVLTGRCWAALACERVQGFRGQSRAAASTARCGLCLTCLARRDAPRAALHMCTVW